MSCSIFRSTSRRGSSRGSRARRSSWDSIGPVRATPTGSSPPGEFRRIRPASTSRTSTSSFSTALGIPHEPVVWDLGPWPAERAAQSGFFAKIDRPVAAIVVATSKPDKDWIPERWGDVARALDADFGLQPVLVGGPSPRERHAESVILARATSAISALGSGLRALAASSTAPRWPCHPTPARCTWRWHSTARSSVDGIHQSETHGSLPPIP